ncbi:glycosyltransferase family 4 protein [Vibrio agarivorans]|uniref:Glycosyltransferase family 4 protein n=1 Tax=Vibrio agarivorans TaxID=153622 RepID=A0ABT7XW46_9VIBR|nr:glycosyltransferase family 4 protein [Vibrio agarivorans]MDN2479999.1 glycosyltransferase family 4 protein [Vibrio agarivorans]
MKILFLSFYYTPDLSAGSFRSTALVDKLKAYDCEIEVITTLPNRYSSYEAEAQSFEKIDNVTIHRVKLPSHNSGMFDQIKAFYKYQREVNRIVRNGNYDLVYATSSRLFTAMLGSQISRKKDIPLYLDIRDIFVDTIGDIFSKKMMFLFRPVFSALEKYTFGRAHKINLVSKGFNDYFISRFPNVDYSFYTNGIDSSFQSFTSIHTEPERNKKAKIRILYAGNIGEGQGLHKIIPKLAQKLTDQAEIRVIGAGGRLTQLSELVNNLNNVEICKPIDRESLIEEYQQADVLFLHLNDLPAFKKVLPSKLFEYAATGKPMLAGVSGYAAEFLKSEVENVGVFDPTDSEMAYEKLLSLSLCQVDRENFKTKYSREVIMKEMAQSIFALTSRSRK